MSDGSPTLDGILAWSRTLSPKERVRLIQQLAADLEADVPAPPTVGRSLRGLWSDLGPGPPDTMVEQARSEMWAAFPRDNPVDEAR
jgi:hypothetical protein